MDESAVLSNDQGRPLKRGAQRRPDVPKWACEFGPRVTTAGLGLPSGLDSKELPTTAEPEKLAQELQEQANITTIFSSGDQGELTERGAESGANA